MDNKILVQCSDLDTTAILKATKHQTGTNSRGIQPAEWRNNHKNIICVSKGESP